MFYLIKRNEPKMSEMNQRRSQMVKISKISLGNMSTDPFNLLYAIGSRYTTASLPPYNLKSHILSPPSPIFCMQPWKWTKAENK